MLKIAIITSHPVQYFAPWFKYLSNRKRYEIKVFYLWDFGVTPQEDKGFRASLRWDIPLLEGYQYEFVPNVSPDPGTHHFWGLQNPSLLSRIKLYQPHAVFLMTYAYASTAEFIRRWNRKNAPLLFRGDSHRLMPRKGLKDKVLRSCISVVFKHFAACLYVGKANYEYFRLHRVPSEKLFYAPYAVDYERFVTTREVKDQAMIWRRELGIPDHHAVILFAGKFVPQKRPIDLFRAFQRASLHDVSLLFTGSGPLENELKKMSENEKNIFFAPFQNQTLMPRTYAACDLFVLPSDLETWGIAVNEAMASSRAVIVSGLVGCAKDIVLSHKNGLVFRAGDVDDLAGKLTEAFSDRERLKEWGEESRRVSARFDWEKMTSGFDEALQFLGLFDGDSNPRPKIPQPSQKKLL